MKYVALLRGINVGGNRKVEMSRLRALFESLGYKDVKTYLNSGNVLFKTNTKQEQLQSNIPKALQKEFGFVIQTLIKTENEIREIAEALPANWKNDTDQKTDVAYLFAEIDSKNTLDKLPVSRDFISLKYVKGAILWNLKRKNYNKSHLNNIISQKHYQLMTVRNANTARFLAQ